MFATFLHWVCFEAEGAGPQVHLPSVPHELLLHNQPLSSGSGWWFPVGTSWGRLGPVLCPAAWSHSLQSTESWKVTAAAPALARTADECDSLMEAPQSVPSLLHVHSIIRQRFASTREVGFVGVKTRSRNSCVRLGASRTNVCVVVQHQAARCFTSSSERCSSL